MSILIWILTFVLVLVSIFLILIVLAQKSKDGGVGAALGGGMTESAFGAETGNVLSRATRNATIAFFILAFALYLAHNYQRKQSNDNGDKLPTIGAPAVSKSVPAPTSAASKGTAPVSPVAIPAAKAPEAPVPSTPVAKPEPQKQ